VLALVTGCSRGDEELTPPVPAEAISVEEALRDQPDTVGYSSSAVAARRAARAGEIDFVSCAQEGRR
jgi:hypothetical protein